MMNIHKKMNKERQIGSVTLNSNEFPEIKSWPITKEGEITLKVKLTSIATADSYDIREYSNVNKGDINARFEILGVKSNKKEEEQAEKTRMKKGIVKTPINISLK